MSSSRNELTRHFLQSLVDENTNKPSEIEQHRTNLPLPEQPPTASDWQSATGKTVNVGSGATEGPFAGDNDTALRGPATAESSARQSQEELGRTTAPGGSVGRQGKENLQGLPKDAQAR